MDDNRNRMGKERNHHQHRSAVFKLLRYRRNQSAVSSSSTRMNDQKSINHHSFVNQTKTNNKRSKYFPVKFVRILHITFLSLIFLMEIYVVIMYL